MDERMRVTRPPSVLLGSVVKGDLDVEPEVERATCRRGVEFDVEFDVDRVTGLRGVEFDVEDVEF